MNNTDIILAYLRTVPTSYYMITICVLGILAVLCLLLSNTIEPDEYEIIIPKLTPEQIERNEILEILGRVYPNRINDFK